MKHKVQPGVSNFMVATYVFLIVLIISLVIGYVGGATESLRSLFVGSLAIATFFVICGIISPSPSQYVRVISSTYRKNIKEALKTEYPHGVVYILENTLRELDKLGLDLDPDSRYFQGNENNEAGTYGFPNKTNLKETIKMARELSKDWKQLDALEPAKASQYMAAIRARIQQEDMYLLTSIKPKGGQDIYYFSYGEEDYQAQMQLENGSHQSSRASNKHPEQDRDLEHTSNNTHNKNILDFPEWLAQNSALQFFSEPEQRKAYTRYTQSCREDNDKPYYS